MKIQWPRSIHNAFISLVIHIWFLDYLGLRKKSFPWKSLGLVCGWVHKNVLCSAVDPYFSTDVGRWNDPLSETKFKRKSVLQTTCSCHCSKSENSSRNCGCTAVLYYVRNESCLTASHLLGILPCQILVILPEHFDQDDNKHNNIADEDNGHR